MKQIFALLACAILIGCSKKENNQFELEIISNRLVLKQNQPIKNILRYKLTNNSDDSYYFNQVIQSRILGKSYDKYLPLYHCYLIVEDSKKDSIKIHCGTACPSPEYSAFLEDQLKHSKALGYSHYEDSNSLKNFVIHPQETIFFEEVVTIPKDEYNSSCGFDKIEENGLGSIFMLSDSTKYKSVITTPALQTIKQNNYKVFNGIIKSKNKVPVEILK